MNVETKTVGCQVDEYKKFGWQHTEDTSVRTGRTSHTRHVLVRDKDMPNYRLICALESKYFSLSSQKKTYEPIDGGWCLVAFLLFIVPGILYVVIKSKQKHRIKEHNAEIDRQMDAVLAEVEPLL